MLTSVISIPSRIQKPLRLFLNLIEGDMLFQPIVSDIESFMANLHQGFMSFEDYIDLKGVFESCTGFIPHCDSKQLIKMFQQLAIFFE
jgi:hypothetical protein